MYFIKQISRFLPVGIPTIILLSLGVYCLALSAKYQDCGWMHTFPQPDDCARGFIEQNLKLSGTILVLFGLFLPFLVSFLEQKHNSSSPQIFE